MKKEYITPCIKVKEIHAPTILAGSPSINNSQGSIEEGYEGGYAKPFYYLPFE